MARIEISLDEYNDLKENISIRDNELHKLEHNILELEKINLELYSELYDIVFGAALYDRLIKWEKTIENAKLVLKKYEESKKEDSTIDF